MDAMKDLPALIKTARERRGFSSQAALAHAVGRDQSFVSRLERGAMKELPAPEVLEVFGDVLGLSMADMLEAAGYLRPAPPSDVLTVRADDPRARVLEIMLTLPDDAVLSWVAALELLTAAASTNTNADVPSEARTTNRKTTA